MAGWNGSGLVLPESSTRWLPRYGSIRTMEESDSELGDFDPQNDSGTDIEADQLIERTDTGVSITTELKRGSGTRDQDKHVLKAKGHSLADAVEKHRQGMDYLEAEVLDEARQMQPEIEEGDEDGN